jgi:hypothetical protein
MNSVNKPEIKVRQEALRGQGLEVKTKLQDRVHYTMHYEPQDKLVEQLDYGDENQTCHYSLLPVNKQKFSNVNDHDDNLLKK